jgi:hypothetical protein
LSEEKDVVTREVATIVPVHPAKLDLVWPIVAPWLAKAMEHGPNLYSTDDVLDCCRKAEFILWVAILEERPIGMAITSLDTYPQSTIASIRWAGGEDGMGREWLKQIVVVLKAWGKHFGAKYLAGMGRKGWLRGYGFRDGGVVFEMDIDT